MKWNILKLLKDELYVDLSEDFLKILNLRLKKSNFKMKDFAESLNVSIPTVNYWFLGVNNFPYSSLCFIIKKLGISILELEENIEGISLKSGKTKVFNPKIRICFDYNFSRFLGHICGDGSLCCNSVISYTNKKDELINDFIKLSKRIFGEVECGTYKSKDGTKNVYLPKVIGKFVLKCFPDIRKGHIPRKFFLSNPSTISGFLGAIFDDEGTVNANGKSLRISLANKKLLEDRKKNIV